MRQMKNTSSSTILDDSTIVAIATPVGVGAISIVRLSGEFAYNIALKLTHRDSLKPRYAHLCQIYDENTAIDEAIVLFFPKPHSYTTQDVCEVQCHGGISSAKSIVELCLRLGARLANAGEFTKRAFLGGRLDLAQTHAIAGIIQSQSLEANKILMRQLKGELSEFVKTNREKLLTLLAFSEVNIDYSEEVEQDYITQMQDSLQELESCFKHIYEVSIMRLGVIEGYTLSIVGKPNVGKSSLLNALLMYERAIVSDVEGTTRDTIEESLQIEGVIVRIVDTAGIRQSPDAIEQIGIAKTKEALDRSDVIIALFDSSRAFDEKDREILDLLAAHTDKHILLVLTKSDLPLAFDTKYLSEFVAQNPNVLQESPLYISIESGGAKAVIESLKTIINTHSGGDSLILTSHYQLGSLKNVLDSITKAYDVLNLGELELFSYHIRDCITALSNITHPYEDSQLLDKLFGTFCLGK